MNKASILRFHGGCHGCTQQLIKSEGVDFCINCMYFDADWDLPNFNNRPPTKAEIARGKIKAHKHNRFINLFKWS